MLIDSSKIFLEWAMHSEDGLALGITPENISVLKRVLKEHGADDQMANDFVSDVINNGEFTEAKKEPAQRDLTDMFVNMEVVKGLKKVYIDPLKSVLEKHPEFAALYDKAPSLEQAVSLYNNPQYSKAVEDINKGIADRTLGPGEVALVFLTKGCKSGGQKTGDLILSNGKVVDVKAWDSTKTLRIEYNSIKNFKGLKFQKALTELATFIRTEKESVDILLSLINDDTFGVRPATAREKGYTTSFLNELNTEEMGSSVFNGLELIGKRLKKIPANKVSDFVELNVNGEKMLVSVKNGKELLAQLKRSPSEQRYNLTLAPIDDKASQIIIPMLKKLQYFAEEISLKTINEEILNSLHYDGIVVVDSFGKNALLIPKDKMKNHLKFTRLSKGVKLEVIL
jgi:hypothetical protein